MNINWNKWKAICTGCLAVAGTALTLAAGIYLPTLISYSEDIGEIRGLASTVNQQIDRMHDRLNRVDDRLSGIEDTSRSIDTNVAAIRERLDEIEKDPKQVLRVAGIEFNDWYFAAQVGEIVYVFPRNKEAAMQLMSGGFIKSPITPYLEGYRINVKAA